VITQSLFIFTLSSVSCSRKATKRACWSAAQVRHQIGLCPHRLTIPLFGAGPPKIEPFAQALKSKNRKFSKILIPVHRSTYDFRTSKNTRIFTPNAQVSLNIKGAFFRAQIRSTDTMLTFSTENTLSLQPKSPAGVFACSTIYFLLTSFIVGGVRAHKTKPISKGVKTTITSALTRLYEEKPPPEAPKNKANSKPISSPATRRRWLVRLQRRRAKKGGER